MFGLTKGDKLSQYYKAKWEVLQMIHAAKKTFGLKEGS